MPNSSTLCRQQAAHHRQIASTASLEKVRRIAEAAAIAWETQALEAEAREAGARGMLSAEDAAIALEFRREDEEAAHAHAIPVPDRVDDDPPQQP